MSKYKVKLKALLHEGLSEPELYGDLVNKLLKIVGKTDFSEQFKKIVTRHKKIDYNILRGNLHAWMLTQVCLITLRPFLIARRRVGPQTKWRPSSSVCFRR